MPLTKAQKQKIIENLKEKIARQKMMIFVDFTGLKVKDLSELRKQLRAEKGEMKVAKKTFMGVALKDSHSELTGEIKKLAGEIAFVFGFDDIILPAKKVWQFSTTHPNLKILGGVLENDFVAAEKIIELAQLSSKDEILARLVSSIASPISSFVNVLQGNIKGLIYALSAIKNNR